MHRGDHQGFLTLNLTGERPSPHHSVLAGVRPRRGLNETNTRKRRLVKFYVWTRVCASWNPFHVAPGVITACKSSRSMMFRQLGTQRLLPHAVVAELCSRWSLIDGVCPDNKQSCQPPGHKYSHYLLISQRQRRMTTASCPLEAQSWALLVAESNQNAATAPGDSINPPSV